MVIKFLKKTIKFRKGFSVLAIASLLFVSFAVPSTAQAQQAFSYGSWSFDSVGGQLQVSGVGNYNVGDSGPYGMKTEAQMGTFNGTLATPLSSTGATTINSFFQLFLNSFFTGPTEAPGNYYLLVNDGGSGGFFGYNVVYKLNWDGFSLTPDNSQSTANNESYLNLARYEGIFQSRLLAATPSGPRSAVNFNLQYFLDPTEYSVSGAPDAINISLTEDLSTGPVDLGDFETLILSFVAGTSTKNFVIPQTLNNSSSFRATVTFLNTQSNTTIFPRSSIIVRFQTVNGVVANVVVDKISNGLTLPASEFEECGLTSLSGCLNNSLRFLFIPSTQTVDSFFDSLEQLNTKVPFVYMAQGVTLINSIYNQPSNSLPSISIPFLSGSIPILSPSIVSSYPFVSLLRNLMAAGMWLTVLYGLYRMALGIHNRDTV